MSKCAHIVIVVLTHLMSQFNIYNINLMVLHVQRLKIFHA